MNDVDGLDLAELHRRAANGEVEYVLEETMRAGVIRARALSHPIERYYARNTITRRQYEAAEKLRNYYEIATHNMSLPSYDGTPAPETYGPRSINITKIDARNQYKKALQSVGTSCGKILVGVIFGELTAEQLGKAIKMDRKQVIGALRVSLDVLADYYGMPE